MAYVGSVAIRLFPRRLRFRARFAVRNSEIVIAGGLCGIRRDPPIPPPTKIPGAFSLNACETSLGMRKADGGRSRQDFS